MTRRIHVVGYGWGLAAAAAVLAFDIVQIMQLVGLTRFPLDEILIYGTSLCIVIPFMLEMLALHHVIGKEKQFWTHAALLFQEFRSSAFTVGVTDLVVVA